MGVLEDLNRLAQQAGQATSDAFADLGRVGHDAAASVDQATRNVAAFAGSGVAGGKVTGPIAEIFGSDPTAFVLNVARKARAASIELLGRVAAGRTGKLSYTFPTPQGSRKVDAKPPSKANANQVALTLALACMDSPATMIEEAGRMSHGLPVKARGLSGFTVFPATMPTGGAQERGFALVDDAAVLALLPIVIPIIVAIAANVLPGLIAAAANLLQELTAPKGPTPDEQAAAAAAADKEKSDGLIKMVAIGAAVLIGGGLLIYALAHKKRAAA